MSSTVSSDTTTSTPAPRFSQTPRCRLGTGSIAARDREARAAVSTSAGASGPRTTMCAVEPIAGRCVQLAWLDEPATGGAAVRSGAARVADQPSSSTCPTGSPTRMMPSQRRSSRRMTRSRTAQVVAGCPASTRRRSSEPPRHRPSRGTPAPTAPTVRRARRADALVPRAGGTARLVRRTASAVAHRSRRRWWRRGRGCPAGARGGAEG
jgi:hypothetical protein